MLPSIRLRRSWAAVDKFVHWVIAKNMSRTIFGIGCWLLLGCGNLVCACHQEPNDLCSRMEVEWTEQGLNIKSACASASLRLLPSVNMEGQWRGGGRDGACSVGANSLACPADDWGTVEVTFDAATARMRFVALKDGVLQGFALEGDANIGGASTWLSNGFQSWSQSGMLALAEPVAPEQLQAAIQAQGDLEVLRTGTELSWWMTLVGGGGPALLAGVLQAQRFRSYVQVGRVSAEQLEIRLVSGATGEAIAVAPGETISSEDWRIEVGADATVLSERYGQALPSWRKAHPRPAEIGWNSWYELWDGVDEAAIWANASLAKEWMAKVAPTDRQIRIVIDDGWQRAWGDWEANEKFPSGLDGLARDLKDKGFKMGVWLAPLLADENSQVYQQHPEWMVAGALYPHPGGPAHVLDVTNPDAASHLRQVIRRLVSWGYDYLKIDFLFAGAYEGGRMEQITGMEALDRALQLIREEAGEEIWLMAVGAPPHSILPYADGWRLGGDIAFPVFGPSWYFIANQARSLSARWMFCLATWCDPDPLLSRSLTAQEVDFGGWLVALAGGGFFLSDDLRMLPQERFGWGTDAARIGLAVGGTPSRPEDSFALAPPAFLSSALVDEINKSNNQVLPRVWRTPDGRRLYLNLDNQEKEIEGVVVLEHGAALLPQR